jgi:hypothetical protein
LPRQGRWAPPCLSIFSRVAPASLGLKFKFFTDFHGKNYFTKVMGPLPLDNEMATLATYGFK